MILPGACVAMILAYAITATYADSITNAPLSPEQIFNKMQANYASLASYNDAGQVITTAGGITMTNTFTTRLARADFYLIEWQPFIEASYADADAQAVWSSGSGNFLGTGGRPQNQGSLDIALEAAAPFSGGASIIVPAAFFNVQEEGFGSPAFDEIRQSDEKSGSVDCYVFKKESPDRTMTFWIGKQDFLIHQIRTEISDEALQSAAVKATKGDPAFNTLLHGYISTETHINIIVNQQFSRSDFIPSRLSFWATADE